MTAQVLQFRPHESVHPSHSNNVVTPAYSNLPSDIEPDTCSCPSCREPQEGFGGISPQPKEEPFSG